MNNPLVIRTSGLNYNYSKKEQTLFDIGLEVKRGSIYGFLGPNGSGKTTTLSLLLGLLKNQDGQIKIFGKEFHENRIDTLRRIGSLIETPSLYGHLTATENLEVYQPVYQISKTRINEVLKIVSLENTGNKKVKNFSLGMKQRLSIALALLPKPKLLILDEPANGLDPAGIIELRHLLKKLNREHDMTILVSSHILSEIEKMVTHVGIIFKGRLLFQGALAELQKLQQERITLFVQTSDNEAAMRILQDHHPQVNGDSVTVAISNHEEAARINEILTRHNLHVYLLKPEENNLEKLFIDLTTDQS